ncbi:MAG: hypothetical protein UY07_C0018G0002 [Parcubacteria group bacterium GW2011_GWA1_47_8]|nr:MAG: hypothetical protein UY07_C0018G0002 [Parcubacteria group bacterium GW2011_GWA1_47_8]
MLKRIGIRIFKNIFHTAFPYIFFDDVHNNSILTQKSDIACPTSVLQFYRPINRNHNTKHHKNHDGKNEHIACPEFVVESFNTLRA